MEASDSVSPSPSHRSVDSSPSHILGASSCSYLLGASSPSHFSVDSSLFQPSGLFDAICILRRRSIICTVLEEGHWSSRTN
ncbi:hypothetical protein Taro_014968 [Colocasia esculenta]|uniref:Uncharacterized protein n=1 Tax=Colocasia esculenta TaxID=4460 RepID=A0A843UAC3_COLES|nr:hypothetical protein [Colocasia esculenta]